MPVAMQRIASSNFAALRTSGVYSDPKIEGADAGFYCKMPCGSSNMSLLLGSQICCFNLEPRWFFGVGFYVVFGFLASGVPEADCGQQILLDANLSVETGLIILDIICVYSEKFKASVLSALLT